MVESSSKPVSRKQLKLAQEYRRYDNFYTTEFITNNLGQKQKIRYICGEPVTVNPSFSENVNKYFEECIKDLKTIYSMIKNPRSIVDSLINTTEDFLYKASQNPMSGYTIGSIPPYPRIYKIKD